MKTYNKFCTANRKSYYYPVIKTEGLSKEEVQALTEVQLHLVRASRAKDVRISPNSLPGRLGMKIVNNNSKPGFTVEW